MFDQAAQYFMAIASPWITRVGMPQSVVLMKAMSQAVRLMSMAVTRSLCRASDGQAWPNDRIIAPAPQAGSQTVIGPSAGSDAGSALMHGIRRPVPLRADQRGEAGFRIPGGKPGSPRPPASDEVLGCFKTEGVPWPEGESGDGGRASPIVAESSQVFVGNSFKPVAP